MQNENLGQWAFAGGMDMRVRTIIVVAVLLVLAGWAVVAQQAKPGAPPREFTNSVGMKFIQIDPGSFKMGSDSGDKVEKPVHDVTLSKGFYLQATEVTQAQWQAVMVGSWTCPHF